MKRRQFITLLGGKRFGEVGHGIPQRKRPPTRDGPVAIVDFSL
jgi:hypothetical protein